MEVAKLHFALAPLCHGVPDRGPHVATVVGMHEAQEGLLGPHESPSCQSQDLFEIGRQGDLALRQVEGPRPDAGGFGRKSEALFAFAQKPLGVLAIRNVVAEKREAALLRVCAGFVPAIQARHKNFESHRNLLMKSPSQLVSGLWFPQFGPGVPELLTQQLRQRQARQSGQLLVRVHELPFSIQCAEAVRNGVQDGSFPVPGRLGLAVGFIGGAHGQAHLFAEPAYVQAIQQEQK